MSEGLEKSGDQQVRSNVGQHRREASECATVQSFLVPSPDQAILFYNFRRPLDETHEPHRTWMPMRANSGDNRCKRHVSLSVLESAIHNPR